MISALRTAGPGCCGHHRVVLHTTEAGRPVYERIGCTTNSPIHFFHLAQV
jgi:hypothetical protein